MPKCPHYVPASRDGPLTTRKTANESIFKFFKTKKKNFWNADQNLVPEPTNQVETQVHQRPGDAGTAVLSVAGYPGTQTSLHRRQIVVR